MSAGLATGLITNAAGRRVPTMVNGREQEPYKGVDGHRLPVTKPARQSVATATIRPTATSGCPISKRRCDSAVCATA